MSGRDQAPAVSVVIATRNRAERLARALDALAAQDTRSPFEVIVVDDASEDETEALLSRRLEAGDVSGLRVVRRDAPSGPGGARNAGWPLATAPIVAFTDDDCEPEPGWVTGLLDAAEPGAEELIQGPTVPNPDDAHLAGPHSRTLEVRQLGPWFPCSNVAYPKRVLERLDGFDSSLIRGEDTDLAWRAIKSGAQPRWAEKAVVRHAVMNIGPVGKLRLAAAWAPAVRVIALHPNLRSELVGGVFWKKSHALLVLALLGLALARTWRPAILLAVPFVRYLRATVLSQGAGLEWMAYQGMHDLTEVAAMVRGSVSARTLLL
jgi:glycosyltransferase involved in cell wall biosynthesis